MRGGQHGFNHREGAQGGGRCVTTRRAVADCGGESGPLALDAVQRATLDAFDRGAGADNLDQAAINAQASLRADNR